MRDRAQDVADRGARLVLIGNGNPEQARAFREEFSGDLDLLLDPELVGYRAARLRSGLLSSFSPRTTFAFLRALRNGMRPGEIEGDAAQLGGAFVITPRGEIPYRYVARSVDGEPDLDEILAALDRSNERASESAAR